MKTLQELSIDHYNYTLSVRNFDENALAQCCPGKVYTINQDSPMPTIKQIYNEANSILFSHGYKITLSQAKQIREAIIVWLQ